MAAASDKDVGRLDVAMDDAFAVRGVERVGNFDGQVEQQLGVQRLARNAMLQGHAVEEFHRDKRLAVVIADFVNGADVRMVQGGSGARLATKALEGRRVLRQFLRQKLQRDEPAELDVFGLVDDAHPATAKLAQDAVVRNGLVRHSAEMLWRKAGQVNEITNGGCVLNLTQDSASNG